MTGLDLIERSHARQERDAARAARYDWAGLAATLCEKLKLDAAFLSEMALQERLRWKGIYVALCKRSPGYTAILAVQLGTSRGGKPDWEVVTLAHYRSWKATLGIEGHLIHRYLPEHLPGKVDVRILNAVRMDSRPGPAPLGYMTMQLVKNVERRT